MPNVHIFADEAGCFRFDRSNRASRYFILSTIKSNSTDLGNELLDLRRSMLRRNRPVGDKFHSSPDRQDIRDEVFNVIQRHQFVLDSTILEKSKAQPQTRSDEATFYQYAWFYHAKYLTPRVCFGDNDVLVTAAALETKVGKAAFKNAFNNAIQAVKPPHARLVTDFPASNADPCLWAADYCCWAIQRKWELQDMRSYDLIGDKVRSEYDLWRRGNHHFY